LHKKSIRKLFSPTNKKRDNMQDNDFGSAYGARPTQEQEYSITKRASELGIPVPNFNEMNKVQASGIHYAFDDIDAMLLSVDEYMQDLRWDPRQNRVVHKSEVIVTDYEQAQPVAKAKGSVKRFQDMPHRYMLNVVEEAIADNAISGKEFDSLLVYDWFSPEDRDIWLHKFSDDTDDQFAARKAVSRTVNRIAAASNFPLEAVEGRNQRYVYHPEEIDDVIAVEIVEVAAPVVPATEPLIPAGYELIGTSKEGQPLYMRDGRVGTLEFTEL